MCGIGFQILQLVVSIWKRDENRDTSGDPWNGRTLEWSTSSPAPLYNFARTPAVSDRDAWWAMKQAKVSSKELPYEDIELPRNSGMGAIIGGFSLVFGFAIIWHIWWLAALSLAGIIACLIIRSLDEDTEYTLKASEVAKVEAAAKRRYT